MKQREPSMGLELV